MISFPNAKINLGLHVVEKRQDGFHNIETVFYPASLCDALEIVPSKNPGVEFTTSGLDIPGDPDSNLCLKACSTLLSHIPHPESHIPYPGVHIHLHKVIPTGAGLGGGSSDGAHTLKLLNDLWQIALSDDQLEGLARRLGSDCAFFIRNRPVFASGKGDHFEPVDLDLSGYKIVIAVPPVHVSTQEAYAMVTPRKPELSLKEIVRMPVESWKGILINDFEEPVMNKYQVIGEVKEKMYHQGALYAAMSGSGAAVFGIFSRQSAVFTSQSSAQRLQFDPSIEIRLL